MVPSTNDRNEIRDILQQYHRIAVVGISSDTWRPSNFVTSYMHSNGYDIIPVNPNCVGRTLFGKRVYASLTEAKEAGELIEIVDVFRRPEYVPPVADEAIAVGAKVLWLQSGIRNDEAARKAHEAGLKVVQNRCIKVEHSYSR